MPTPPPKLPKPPVLPPTYLYVPMPKPVDGILQYKMAPNGKLSPLKPPLVRIRNSQTYSFSVTDPKGHFLYLGTHPLQQFRISKQGQIIPLKPATVAAPEAQTMTFTPDGRFLYITHTHFDDNGPTDKPDDLIVFRVAKDGTLHPVRGGTIPSGNQVTALAVDNTGRYLYACVYNYDLSGNLAYTMEFHINPDGTLKLLPTNEYNCLPAPVALKAAASGPSMYMASKDGLSVWHIKPDGTLHLVKEEDDALGPKIISSFVVDAADKMLISIGNDELAFWHELPDGTLMTPFSLIIARDGFLYGSDKDIPDGKAAAAVGIVYDAPRRMLYVKDSNESRVFRYLVKDNSITLQNPWLSTGKNTFMQSFGPANNPLFTGRGH